MPTVQDFATKIQQLAEQFHSQLPEIRQALQERYLATRERPGAETLEQLQKIVHRLAGSGATFGYPAISQSALALERALDSLAQSLRSHSSHDGNIISLDPNDLRNAYERLQNTLLTSQSLSPILLVDEKLSEAPKILLYCESRELRAELLSVITEIFDHHSVRPLIQTARNPAETFALCKSTSFDAFILLAFDQFVFDLIEQIAANRTEKTVRVFQPQKPMILINGSLDISYSIAQRIKIGRGGVTDLLDYPLKERQLEDALSPVLHSPEKHNYRVLLLDDDHDLLAYYRAGLESVGLAIKTISQADEALETIASFQPELLIIDVHLDGMSGFEVAKALRLKLDESSIPIVYLSTDPSAFEPGDEPQPSRVDFLLKPLTSKELLNSITPLLKQSRRRLDQIRSYEASLLATQRASDQDREAKNQMSQFLATMTHEIRTPLNGILGMTRLLARTDLTAQQEEYVALLERAGTSLLAIANNVLDHSKLKAGKIELERNWVSLSDLKDNLKSLFSGPAKERGTLLFFDWTFPEHVKFYCDESRILQILVNLLGNAIKFTRGGLVAVRGSFHTHSTLSELEFAVCDSGPGIAAQDQSRLFHAFEQGKASSFSDAGTGLGLTIAAQLAELMDATLQVESEVGSGATFSMKVPTSCKFEPITETKVQVAPLSSIAFTMDDSFSTRERQILGTILRRYNSGSDNKDQRTSKASKAREHRQILISRSKEKGIAKAGQQDFIELNFEHGPYDVSSLAELLIASNRPSTLNLVSTLPTPLARKDRRSGSPPFEILVAEDEPINQTYISALIQYLGFRCTIVGDGQSAYQFAKSGSYDLIILDCRMPVMSGPEAASAIRSFDKNVPIIALTAETDWEQHSICLVAGMSKVITKPIDESALECAITEALSAADLHRPKENQYEPWSLLDVLRIEELKAIPGQDGRSLFDTLFSYWPSLVNEFLSDCSAASKEEDWDRIEFAAHRLKGAAGNLGAEALREHCSLLEKASQRKELVTIINLLHIFINIENRTREALLALQASYRESG